LPSKAGQRQRRLPWKVKAGVQDAIIMKYLCYTEAQQAPLLSNSVNVERERLPAWLPITQMGHRLRHDPWSADRALACVEELVTNANG
jgi:hypothetical protein